MTNRRSRARLTALLFPVLRALAADGSAAGPHPEEKAAANQVLERYLREAVRGSRGMSGAPLAFEIDASIPRLRKHGIMRGIQYLTETGRLAFTQLGFVGDKMVKTAVISRFLAAEADQGSGGEDIEIAKRNYGLRYKGTVPYNDRTAVVFRTEPRRRRVGFFRGELWLDSETAQPLREWGELVKSPSVLLSNIYFVRDYFPFGQGAQPRRIIVKLRVSFVGPVEVTMWFDELQEHSGFISNPGGSPNRCGSKVTASCRY